VLSHNDRRAWERVRQSRDQTSILLWAISAIPGASALGHLWEAHSLSARAGLDSASVHALLLTALGNAPDGSYSAVEVRVILEFVGALATGIFAIVFVFLALMRASYHRRRDRLLEYVAELEATARTPG
jgi:hypothetical protein